MIKIQNLYPINKGSLMAKCDVHIAPWKMTFHDVKIFEKGANRWIAMPSKDFVNAEGITKYSDMISFDSDAVKKRFTEQIKEAVDKYLESNPEMKVEDVITEDEYPF